MGFSAKQRQALKRDVDPRHIRTREAHGREISYIEGWYAITEANRIFGFDGWNRETLDSKCVLARENRGCFTAVYTAKVRISVQTNDRVVVRDGHGSGEGRGTFPGDVHDTALKAAETDATKRALATFGSPFGLTLYSYGKSTSVQAPVAVQPSPAMTHPTVPAGAELRRGSHPDDTTPIPRPRNITDAGSRLTEQDPQPS
jgi:DNA recombination protein Rad52